MMPGMLLDSDVLARLRDELVRRGGRVSMPPPSSPDGAKAESADVLAVMQRVAPMCELLYLLMVADDESHAREQEVLRGAIRALTDGALRTSAIDALLATFEGAVRAHGREQRLAQVAGQLAADRAEAETAFMLAAVMAIADDERAGKERDTLHELRELLGISSTRARFLVGEARHSLS
jgi:uncharacterized tellurite resistance protein B-like protein